MSAPDWLLAVRQAEQCYDQKRPDEAVSLAERALQGNPDAAAAHQVLGLVSLDRGRVREAGARLAHALALRGHLVPAHNGLGRAYSLLGEVEQALAHLDTALFLQPDHAIARFNRALLWLKQGRYREGWIE